MKPLQKILSQNLKKAREHLEMTQIELAEKAGVARQVIVKLENGQAWPTYSTLEAIAGALRINETELFSAGPEGDKTKLISLVLSLDPSVVKSLIKAVESGSRIPVKSRATGS